MSIRKLLNEPAQRTRELERLLERQQLTIERLRGRRKTSLMRTKQRKAKGCFLRIIFGDVHGSYLSQDAVNAFLADIRELAPAELVCVGDLLDCAGFLAEHHVIGVIPQLDYTYEQDAAVANEFLDHVAKATNNVPMRLIEGNHEARIARQICKMTIRNPKDSRFMERLYGAGAVLNLEKRGIEFIRRDHYYDGLGVSGTIKLEPFAVAQHGEAFCGQTASRELLRNLGRNVFHGHTHRLGIIYGENMEDTLLAVNTGTLAQKRPLYGLTKTTGWVHGYAVQVVEPGKGFLAFPVPIIDGVSYLTPLLKVLK
jgi:UDP-2,3-diacylglucosamine pyrophosphatase LpxH